VSELRTSHRTPQNKRFIVEDNQEYPFFARDMSTFFVFGLVYYPVSFLDYIALNGKIISE
jgi:hypothetical protein